VNKKSKQALFLAIQSAGAFVLTLFALQVFSQLFGPLPSLAIQAVLPLLAIEVVVFVIAVVVFCHFRKRV